LSDTEEKEETEQPKLIVSASPHIRSPENVSRIMWTVAATLVPAGLWGWYWFGFAALRVVAFSVITAMVSEAVVQRLIKKEPVTLHDGSAVVTGMLYAYCLPPSAPWYVAVVGAAFAVVVVKHLFGGLGYNIWNPALAGRAFVQIAYASKVSLARWPVGRMPVERMPVDTETAATPLVSLAGEAVKNGYGVLDLFLGKVPGCIGEVSAVLLLLGAVVLVVKKYVKWQLPAAYVGTVAVLALVLPPREGHVAFSVPYHIFAGGLILGAFFMATDMVTSPITVKGMIIFGIGCGVLTALIRIYGGYPEGVCYSILLMNTATPMIDKYTRPRKYGAVGTAGSKKPED